MFPKPVVRSFAAALLVAFSSIVASAQQIPSPAQAQQMLQSNPGLISRLQQMMAQSGLTPDQIRQKLQEQGYPQSLLDQYLAGGTGADSLAAPSADVFAAVRALGISDTLGLDSLSMQAAARRRVKAFADSAFLDTLRRSLQ